MNPEISVILTTFRRGNNGLLKRSIDSVLMQTYRNFEFIIIDDGSTDKTQQLVQSYTDQRIRTIRHRENSGIHSKRLNEGIRLARGKYICFQFDDDFWLPHHLELLHQQISALPDAGMVFGLSLCLHAETQEISLLGDDYSPERLFGGNCIGNQAVLIRKEVLQDVGGYDEDIGMIRFCDWDLWVRIAKGGYRIEQVPLVTSINHYAHRDSLRQTVPYDFAYILARMQQERSKYLRKLVDPHRQEIPKEGYLLKGENAPDVYWVAGGKKYPIPSEEIFSQLQFRWEDVRVRPQNEVNQIPSGIVLTPEVFL